MKVSGATNCPFVPLKARDNRRGTISGRPASSRFADLADSDGNHGEGYAGIAEGLSHARRRTCLGSAARPEYASPVL